MAINDSTPRGWNLFARVLHDLLAARGYRLGHLDDRAQVHPFKVSRLQRSLSAPKSFPVLTPEEMEEVSRVFGLTCAEQIRLRAALLATAMEEMLMDRINHEDALRAAEQILPILERALHAHDGDQGLGLARGTGGALAVPEGETALGRYLGPALANIDRATLALHLSRSAQDRQERIAYARRACEAFETASHNSRRPTRPSRPLTPGASGRPKRKRVARLPGNVSLSWGSRSSSARSLTPNEMRTTRQHDALILMLLLGHTLAADRSYASAINRAATSSLPKRCLPKCQKQKGSSQW